ncbi:molybdenum cofactor guanylyltransferase [Fictibacillus fluitans]|uniref:Probable molybdenum cofactor guanylyltransferase n=1 Tax=Fictibacillus fluitans TaxID=3058422 RepID=A0ABT8HXA2_9BACL|nr:molybdenum cofactor guanylyltransferase [Fictibacillus sp. NE201]MDN4525381.1 molybdenum cofactor guanylyltransferase [Fictibacillus sp. NE201]
MDPIRKNGRTGIVLAGGGSSRFPFHKAFARYKNRYFYEHAVGCMKQLTDDVVLVSRTDIAERMKNADAEVIFDLPEYQGQGPLSGILSGMTNRKESEWFAIVTCDMPFVMPLVFEQLFSIAEQKPGTQAVVPVAAGRNQPLAAIYHRSCKDHIIRLLLEEKRSMYGLLQSVNTTFADAEEFDISQEVFVNINTDEEYKHYIESASFE